MAHAIASRAMRRGETNMPIVTILYAPRYAASPSSRWMSAAVFVLLACIGSVVGVVTHAAASALLLYAAGLVVLWWGWFSSLLLLARDGRRLGVPCSARNNAAAVCFYALAGVALPALVAAVLGLNVQWAALVPALATAGVLAWLLLPYWIAAWIGFVPALYVALQNRMQLPAPTTATFAAWGWLLLAVLVAISIVRARALLRSGQDGDGTWSGTFLTQTHRKGWRLGWWSEQRNPMLRGLRGRSLEVDFRGIGVDVPARSIRVALGAWYVPQTVRGRLRAFARLALSVAIFVAVILLLNGGHNVTPHQIETFVFVNGCLFLGIFGTGMLALGSVGMVHRRWQSHADLALLALLPGIGNGASVTRSTAAAALRGPALVLGVLWLFALAGTVAAMPSAQVWLLLTLFEIAVGTTVAMRMLQTIAGTPLRVVARIVLGIAWCALLVGSINVVVALGIGPASITAAGWGAACALAWVALIAWTLWRTLRAWRVLQRRPHPFLGNT
ncbi:MAG TPA: hypothetical protein VF292_05485 [Rhodanobacteraceae bacterium]